MRRNYLILLSFYFFCLFIISCNSRPDKKIVPSWTSEILGPLIKTKITGENLDMLDSIAPFLYFKLMDIGYGIRRTQMVIVPDTSFPDFTLNTLIHEKLVNMKLQKGRLRFEIFNEMDIDLKKGTTFTLSQENNILLEETLNEDLSPKTGKFISQEVLLDGKSLNPELLLHIKNLSTHGSSTPMDIYDKKIGIKVELTGFDLEEITLKPGAYYFSDTSAFNLNGRAVNTESIAGDLYTYIKNNLSFNIEYQAYFLNDQYLVKDSLYNGYVSVPMSTALDAEKSIKQSIISEQLKNINQSKFIHSKLKIYSDQNVVIRKGNFLEAQIVGDLKFKVNN